MTLSQHQKRGDGHQKGGKKAAKKVKKAAKKVARFKTLSNEEKMFKSLYSAYLLDDLTSSSNSELEIKAS